MLCPNCHLDFNNQANIPRILVYCGHTFCHACIEEILKEDSSSCNTVKRYSVDCPDCGTTNQVADGMN